MQDMTLFPNQITIPDTVDSDAVYYPETDGEPMAETDIHRDQMADALIYPLKEHFRDRDDVYVSGNLLLYYEEGNPKASISPDVLVTMGISAALRRIYKVWEEGKAPDVIFELTSPSTRGRDLGFKRYLYEDLGVREYFLFDPLREYLQPPLFGFRAGEGPFFTSIQPVSLPDEEWELKSEILGLILRTSGNSLRLFDPVRNAYLCTHGEQAVARRTAEAAQQKAEAAYHAEMITRQKAEAEIVRLQALLRNNEAQ